LQEALGRGDKDEVRRILREVMGQVLSNTVIEDLLEMI